MAGLQSLRRPRPGTGAIDHPGGRPAGQYENAISPVPDPDGWFRARIVLDGRSVSVFVDDATVPTLTVDALTKPRGGMVGLWLVNGSSGDFANLRLLPKDP